MRLRQLPEEEETSIVISPPQEKYDNVTEGKHPDDDLSVDVFSHNATVALNDVITEWASEGDLTLAMRHRLSGRFDLCTNEPIVVYHQCGSLPDHYHGTKKEKPKGFKRSFISALRRTKK